MSSIRLRRSITIYQKILVKELKSQRDKINARYDILFVEQAE